MARRRWPRPRARRSTLEVARMGACEDRGARCGNLVEDGFVIQIVLVDRRLLERAAQVLLWRARYGAVECARRSHAHAWQWLRRTPAGPAPQQALPRPTPGACHASHSGSHPRPLQRLEQQLSSDSSCLPSAGLRVRAGPAWASSTCSQGCTIFSTTAGPIPAALGSRHSAHRRECRERSARAPRPRGREKNAHPTCRNVIPTGDVAVT